MRKTSLEITRYALSILIAVGAAACSSSDQSSPDTPDDIVVDGLSDSGEHDLSDDDTSIFVDTESDVSPTDTDDDSSPDSDITDTMDEVTADNGAYWQNLEFSNDYPDFDRSDHEPVIGWILLDFDQEKILADIDTARGYGINHIQLSHDIIMDIDDLLGDDAATTARVDTINAAVNIAHTYGMKVFLWAHEFQDGDIVVCYGPDGAIWDTRAEAYRNALALVPGVDGIILMFGSAGASPWYTLCDCDWCATEFPGEFVAPPQDVRIQLVVEHIADVLQSIDKELIVRVFAHEPDENLWHADGLARARNCSFTSMHKSDVGDWQPYNPHDPTLGQTGSHPSILEMDAAGEYFGRSELPFASPVFYRYRLKHAFEQTAIGAVARISRGSDSALGTPNEVNLRTITDYITDPMKTIDQVWNDFISTRYYPEGNADVDEIGLLTDILTLTLPIMTKTHYVLGLWALEKGSDIPDGPSTDQFGDRGRMPKWDTEWTDIWDAVKSPTVETVQQIFDESTEGVMIAARSLELFEQREWNLAETDHDAIYRQLRHQYYAARTWRAVKTYIYARKSGVLFKETQDTVSPWAEWARVELDEIAGEMDSSGLSDVSIGSPARIRLFLSNTITDLEVTPQIPPDTCMQPLYIHDVTTESVEIDYRVCSAGSYFIDYTREFPHYDETAPVATVETAPAECETRTAAIDGLEPDTRYIFRLTFDDGERKRHGGDFWEMTRNEVPQNQD